LVSWWSSSQWKIWGHLDIAHGSVVRTVVTDSDGRNKMEALCTYINLGW
jgi:hypothetical protein